MATATVQLPSHDRVEPGSKQLRWAEYPVATKAPEEHDPSEVATNWVSTFSKALNGNDSSAVGDLFWEQACWRDQLGLSWNYRTFCGPLKIREFLNGSLKGSRITDVKIDNTQPNRKPQFAAADYDGKVQGVMTFLKIETDVGRGRGLVRLLQDSQGKYKAFTLLTTMHELKGHEEKLGLKRPNGVDHGTLHSTRFRFQKSC